MILLEMVSLTEEQLSGNWWGQEKAREGEKLHVYLSPDVCSKYFLSASFLFPDLASLPCRQQHACIKK